MRVLNSQLQFSPGANFIGTADLVYAITDSQNSSAQANVTLVIEASAGVTPPVVNTPADITLDSEGLFTSVDLGEASAIDANGNPLPVTLLDSNTTFGPGSHVVLWQVEDSFGISTTASQQVNVNPQISIVGGTEIGEGNATVEILLNGPAMSYPFTVSYSVSGTADEQDHTAQSGMVTFESGTQQIIEFSTFVDDRVESNESIIFSLNESQNIGASPETRFTITEANIAPDIQLAVTQNGTERLTIAQDEAGLLLPRL